MLTHLLTSALKELKVGPGMLGALGMEPWKVSWLVSTNPEMSASKRFQLL